MLSCRIRGAKNDTTIRKKSNIIKQCIKQYRILVGIVVCKSQNLVLMEIIFWYM